VVWVKLDDKFHGHRKTLALFDGPCPGDAIALWTLANSWCGDQLTDGKVPLAFVRRSGLDKHAADELVRVGFWIRTEDGYEFHDWLARNKSRETVEAERASANERKAKGKRPDGNGSGGGSPDGPKNGRATDARTSGEPSAKVRPTDFPPDPTRPDPTQSAARSCDAAAVAAFFAPGAENKPQTGLSPETAVQEAWSAALHGGKWSGHIPRAHLGDVLRMLAERGLGTDVLPPLMARWSAERKSTAPPKLEYFARDLAGLLDTAERPASREPVSEAHKPFPRLEVPS
jgi:hypothetical protein